MNSTLDANDTTTKIDHLLAIQTSYSRIEEQLRNFSDQAYPHTTPTPHSTSKSNKVAPLFIIFGAVIIFFICIVMAKSRKRKSQNEQREDAYHNWCLGNDDTEAGRLYNDRMIDHKATCHDHKSHHYRDPHFHGGHHDHGSRAAHDHGTHHVDGSHFDSDHRDFGEDGGGCD